MISSAALYLVGSVYVDAYYGRLAIEVTSLDLPPPYVALQSVHALWGLLDYPLLLVYVLYRIRGVPRNEPVPAPGCGLLSSTCDAAPALVARQG